MSRQSIKAGNAYVEIGVKNSLQKGMRGIESTLKKTGRRISGAGLAMAGLSTSILAPLAAATKGFAAMGTEVAKMSTRTGVSVRALSELRYAAERSGVEFDDLGGAMEELNIRLGEAVIDQTGPAAEALKKLGLDANQLAKMDLPERLEVLADAISSIDNNAQRQFLADEIFGGDAFRMMTLLDQGSAGIRRLREEAREFGQSMSSEQAKSAQAFTAAMARLSAVAKGLVVQIGGALAPILSNLSDIVSNNSKGFIDFLRANQSIIQVVAAAAAGIGAIGVSLVGLGGAVTIAGAAFGGLATLIGMISSPIAIATAAAVGLGVVLVKYTDLGSQALTFLIERFGPLVSTIREAGSAIAAALQLGDMQAAWELITSTMELTWLDLTQEIRNVWDEVVSYVLNAGILMAQGIGKAIKALGGVLNWLINKYEKIYNKIYNAVIAAGGKISGVDTIGGTSGSAFNNDFGGAADAARSTAGQLQDFGQAMDDSARARREQRERDKAAARAAREQRMADLRSSIGQTSGDVQKRADDAEQAKLKEKQMQDDELARLRKQMRERQSGLDGLQQNGPTGPSGSFSAQAAVISAMGFQSVDQEQLKEQKQSNEFLGKIARNTKEAKARFA